MVAGLVRDPRYHAKARRREVPMRERQFLPGPSPTDNSMLASWPAPGWGPGVPHSRPSLFRSAPPRRFEERAAARGLARVGVAARVRTGAVGHVSRSHVDSGAGMPEIGRERGREKDGCDTIFLIF
jgi:hypothetical protein